MKDKGKHGPLLIFLESFYQTIQNTFSNFISDNNNTTFSEIFLISSGNLNDYVAHIYRKHADLDGSNITCTRGCEEVRNANNKTNLTVTFYEQKK